MRLLSSWRRFWKLAPLLLGQPGSDQAGHRAGERQRAGGGARRWGGACRRPLLWAVCRCPAPGGRGPVLGRASSGRAAPRGPVSRLLGPPPPPATAPLSPASLGKPDPLAILSRNATHPLLHISTLYEAREEEDGAPRAPQDVGSLITIPPPQQILIATFDEPRTVVSTVEF